MKIAIIFFLLVSIFLLPARGFAQQSSDNSVDTQAQSVADIARQNRPKDAKVTSQRTFTDDDVKHGDPNQTATTEAPKWESSSATLQKFRNLGPEDFGKAVLKAANVADVDFPNRRGLEQELFNVKQRWIDQEERAEAHKGSSTEGEETSLAARYRQNFENVEERFILEARAVSDPVAKSHLQYEKQFKMCQSMSGILRSYCFSTLDPNTRTLKSVDEVGPSPLTQPR